MLMKYFSTTIVFQLIRLLGKKVTDSKLLAISAKHVYSVAADTLSTRYCME